MNKCVEKHLGCEHFIVEEAQQNMAPQDDFDDFIERIEPMTVFEQREMILRYFAVVLEGLSAADVRMLREHLRRRFPADTEQDTIFEVIDGHLALRDLTRPPRAP